MVSWMPAEPLVSLLHRQGQTRDSLAIRATGGPDYEGVTDFPSQLQNAEEKPQVAEVSKGPNQYTDSVHSTVDPVADSASGTA